MTANKKQIGGKHYQSAYQHWDWVLDNDLSYLEGCATKYIVRWRDKGGVEDLKKAAHYIEKLIEPRSDTIVSEAVAVTMYSHHTTIGGTNCRCVPTPIEVPNRNAKRIQSTMDFLEQYPALSGVEILIIQHLVCSSELGHAEKALNKLQVFIAYQESLPQEKK